MKTNSKLAFALSLAAIIALVGCASFAPASVVNPPAPSRTIAVTGEGTASAKPDTARATIGVETVAKTAADATAQNTDKMNGVVSKLKSLGVQDKDIQTSNYSVTPERNTSRGPSTDILDYRVSNTVTVTIRDLTQVGAILDQATQAGANNVYGISFSISDPTKVRGDARAKAMADAQARADDLAKLGGVTRGDPISISETTSSPPINFASAPAALAVNSEVPVEAGSLNVSVRVQVTYAIR